MTARNLAAIQLIEKLDADIQALTAEQLRAAKEAAAVADNLDDDEEEEDGELDEEDACPNNQNPANDVDAAADHQNAADDEATAPNNGAADKPTADGRLEQDGRGQPPRDPVVASDWP